MIMVNTCTTDTGVTTKIPLRYQANWSKDSFTTVFLRINVGSMKTSFDNLKTKCQKIFELTKADPQEKRHF